MQNVFQSVRGKDSSPKDTVKRIEKLLDKADIRREYMVVEPTLSDCWTSRVSATEIGGDIVGANGKGIGVDFCKASAYGEFMERLQNRAFTFIPRITDSCWKEFNDVSGRKLYTVRGDEQPECIQYIKQQIASSVKDAGTLLNPELLTDILLERLGIEAIDNAFETDRFYNVCKDEFVDLPTLILYLFTVTNGMAAGNTLEEAIVQGMSEIMERYASISYINGEYVPPEIPHEYLKRYPEIYNIISAIEESGQYRVIVSDCSMGKNIPVVCGTIVDSVNNKFGIKFGSHPDMQIALERVFTEAFQGRTLEEFIKSNDLSFSIDANTRNNTFNFIKVGMGYCLPSVFLKKPDYEFEPWEDVSTMGNKELARRMVNLAGILGGDVYILDRSYLGFPTVYIYAQGVSEVHPMDILQIKEQLFLFKCIEHFRHLNDCDDAQVTELLKFADLKSNAYIENTVSTLSGIPLLFENNVVPQDAVFFRAVCLYRLGKFADSATLFSRTLKMYEKGYSQDMYSYVNCVATYVDAKTSKYNDKDIEDVLNALYPRTIVEKVIYDFADPMQALSRIYPLCDGRECDNCESSVCRYKQVRDLYGKLVMLEAQNTQNPEQLRSIFAKE